MATYKGYRHSACGAKLVVEFMFYFLVDHGDIGSYEIKAGDPLKWMGIDIKLEEPKEDKDHA